MSEVLAKPAAQGGGASSFAPAAPGSWTRADGDLATHEAAHSVTAAVLGLEVTEVRIDRPHPGADGLASIPVVPDDGWLTDFHLERHLVSTLAGPLVRGHEIRWPPRPDAGSDERAAYVVVHWLKLDEAGWRRVEALTQELLAVPGVKRAVRAVAFELLEFGAVPGWRVAELVREAGVSYRSPGCGPASPADHAALGGQLLS